MSRLIPKLGSLIGIFIASARIVIGADTVLSGTNSPDPTRVEEICELTE